MAHDWLLVETLGDEPVVVAQGRQLKNLVPLAQFLRRSPNLAAIHAAIEESARSGRSVLTSAPHSNRTIRAEPVQMPDGHVHGVHVWSGPTDIEPTERPIPGPLLWDLTSGVATDSPQALINSGKNPDVESTHGRAFADDLPARDFSPNEARVLVLAIRAEPGQTICSSWDLTDWQGGSIRVGFVARNRRERFPDGSEHLVARGMNWRGELEAQAPRVDVLAERILHSLAQPGVHRALVGLRDWRLLKWLDEPISFYDWRGTVDAPRVHPDDGRLIARMTTDFADGPASGVLRLRHSSGGWMPIHVTVNRVELEEETYAGLVALRLPTERELAEVGLSAADIPAL